MSQIRIGKRVVGDGHPCYVIAEAGVNHNGSAAMAKKMVDAAKAAGADAIKFQSFKADSLVVKNAAKADYQRKTTGGGSQYEMIKKLELSEKEFREIAAYAKMRGITILSSPFDEDSADALYQMGVPAFKMASGEITNFPLLAHVANKGKPIILSTGMATMLEIAEALDLIFSAGNENVALLHCVTSYPARMEQMNLRVIHTMKRRFCLPVGLSDHTPGIHASLAAVALGASIIEKHFTPDKDLPGPDHKASLDPDELKNLVAAIRHVESGLGDGTKALSREEERIKLVARRSIVAKVRIPKGSKLDRKMLAYKRPGTGIEPKHLYRILGKKVKRDITKDALISLEDVQ